LRPHNSFAKLKRIRSVQITVLLILSVFGAAAQNQIPYQKNKIDRDGRRQGKWCITFNASWKETKAKDSVAYYRVIEYVNDKPTGITNDYYVFGKKQWSGTLLQDRPVEIPNGGVTYYFEDGSVSLQANFVEGIKTGLEIRYNRDGTKHHEAQYENNELTKLDFFQNNEKIKLQQLWERANDEFDNRRYEQAEESLYDLYAGVKLSMGADDRNCAFIMNQLSLVDFALGKNDDALNYVGEMRRICELKNTPKDTAYRDMLYGQMMPLKKAGRHNEIGPLLEKVISIELEISGENSPTYTTFQRTLGDYYWLVKKYQEAERVYLQSIERIKKLFPMQPEQYNYETASLGNIYESTQNYEQAEKLYRESIEIYRQNKDTTAGYSRTLSKLVHLYETQARNLEGIPYAQEMIVLEKTRKGTMSQDYIDALLSLSKLYQESEQFDKCEPLLKERAEIFSVLHGSDSSAMSGTMFEYALLYDEQHKSRQAEFYFLKALELLARKNLNDQATLLKKAEILAYLGALYAYEKNILKAETTLLEANEIARSLNQRNDFVIAQIYEKIGTSQLRIENYEDAEDAYKEAADIAAIVYGTNHHNYFVSWSNLCLTYTYTNRSELTIKTINDLIATLPGDVKNSPTYISLLESKVLAHQKLEETELVLKLRQEIGDYYLKTFGIKSPSYTRQLSKIILDQTTSKKFKEAEKNLTRLDSINSLNNVTSENTLVLKMSLAYHQKDYTKATEFARRIHEIGIKEGNPKKGLIELGLNSFANNQFADAHKAYRSYIDIVIDEVRKTFPYLSDNQKVGFYNSEVDYHLDLYSYIALVETLNFKFGRDSLETINARKINEKIHYIAHPNNALVFNYQLITKGILFESSQKTKKTILESKDDNLIKLFNQWQAKQEEMNEIFQEPDSKEKEGRKNKKHEEIKALEKKLALKSGYFSKDESPNYTWRDVQKKLKKDEALVEILAISAGQKLNRNKNKYSDMYVAFIITPNTKKYPLCVRIGVGDSLEGRYAKNYQNCVMLKLKDEYSYNKYWKHLSDTLKGYKKIFFAPDGIYHKININTLQNPLTRKFVLEEKEIVFISQSRDFITREKRVGQAPSSIILFGAPNYNGLPQQGSSPDNSILLPKAGRAQPAAKRDSTQRFFTGNSITELPGTLTEINNVATIAEHNQLPVEKYSGDDANESLLKTMRPPSVLHIATHGFFMNEKAVGSDQGGGRAPVFANFTSSDLKNPLRRSGLLLSFCHQAFSHDTNLPMQEDGILTADEAQNLHLDNTEMVVMSACETGLGEVKNGEGVYGLQRAFQTAGAKSVLMSLWKVSDQATQELMTGFYNEWFKLKNSRQAFRQAQLNLLKKYPEPYYWGAFVLVGE
jgi:hypothetical protein